ncbi:fibronectin type III domain-containing protein [Psychroflexus halocasei]|uniref:Por secretion system C-terminal sorting domain-containing protein n=1 Tax=Psychroflexus halocasei TaxID=908615 RepID=A0A1H4BUH0_9FLAO|nr:fibronectin type III domain-containing protein [Psychroflexus halocasei]SEA51806.1 Por secretion system C-terminal sorting domain-containing protein [Psychroflexus halocasei]
MKKFTFLCIASLITTIMWSQVYVDEDFSGGALPSGWANNDLQGNGQTWEFDNPGGRTGNMPINAPFAIIDSDNYGSGGIQDAALETIAFDVSAASAVQLDFDYYYRTCCGSTIAVEVFDGTSWVEVYGIEEPSSADPAHMTLDITAALNGAANAQVRFHYVGDWDYYWMIDNVTIQNVTCLQPTALTEDAVTTTTADVSWTAGETETAWNVSWGAPGYTPDTDDLGTDIANTTSFQITNLTANTNYEFYIQADCGNGDESDWTGPVGFMTDCVEETTPWTDDVEGQTGTDRNAAVDGCWTANPTSEFAWNVSDSNTLSGSTGPNAAHSGSKFFFTESSNGSTSDIAELISPLIDVSSLTTPTLSFYYHMYGASMGDMNIYVFDGTNWNLEGTISGQQQTSGSAPWEEMSIVLSGYSGVIQIKFEGVKGTSFTGDMAIDDISVIEMPTCLKPTALAVDAVTTTTADVSWTAGDTETAWNISWGASGYTPGTDDLGTDVVNNTPTYQISALMEGTSFEAYVQASCGGNDLSNWVGPLEFFTTEANNDCNGAIALTCGQTVTGSTEYATASGLSTQCGSFSSSDARDLFYTFEADGSSDYLISLNQLAGTSGFDGVLFVYSDVCGNLTELNCSDTGNPEQIELNAPAVGTYTVRVFDYSGTGEFTIGVECIAPGFVYTGGVWTPSDPNTNATATDDITVMDGVTSFTSNIEVNDVTVMSGATLNVGSVLTINGDITNDGDLVFISTANGNGELASVPVTSTITGQVTVQRSMSAKRSYRMVSSAVTTTTSIHDNWQEGATSNTDNPNPGFGTHITGSTTDQMNGFDGTLTGNTSMFMINASTQAFEAIGDTDVNVLTAGEGYLMYVRGSRAVDLTADPVSQADETVLRATGSLFTGTNTQNFATTNAGEFVMFGNPYQSTVDLNAVIADSQNLNGNFAYYYDPNLGTYGGYVTVTLPAGTNASNSQANEYLQPGQAVQLATASNGLTSIVFNESSKAPGNLNSTFSNGSLNADQIIIGQLFTAENHANNESLHDSFQLLFNSSYSNELNNNDAVKPFNFTENIGIGSVESAYSVERRALPEVGEEISLFVNNYAHENYMLRLEVNELEGVKVYLNDNYTEESVLLESGENLYGFSVNELSLESISSNRFSLSFERVTLGLDQPEADFGIEIYPNPTEIGDAFYITTGDFKGKDVEVRMIDMYGKTVYNTKLSLDDTRVKIQPQAVLSSGVYMVSIINKDKKVEKRLIIM